MIPTKEVNSPPHLVELPTYSIWREMSPTTFKGFPTLYQWGLVRVLAIGALLAVSVVTFFDISLMGTPDGTTQNDELDIPSLGDQQQRTADGTDELTVYPLEDFWVKVERRVEVGSDDVWKAPSEAPRLGSGVTTRQTHQAVQQELISLGFATIEEGEFQAFVAEADDAGYKKLLFNAGYTEQQIRNAQERQRKAYEEAGADAWFRLLVSISALAELRRQGFADFRGNINIAGANDAGLKDLLLRAGVTESRISDIQHRQHRESEAASRH